MAGRPFRWHRWGAAAALLFAAGAGGSLVVLWLLAARPYPRERLKHAGATSLAVVDRNGALLRRLPLLGGGRAEWTPLGDIPPPLVTAIVAGEDRDFFSHRGVSLLSLLRAGLWNLRERRIAYGGSTLTMQLARLLRPRPRRSLLSKLAEILDALRLERLLSKQEILEQYLNRAYFGGGAFGAAAAAAHLFGKPLSGLSMSEATLLAVLPRAPSAYEPRRDLAKAVRRRHRVLEAMVARGLLLPAEAQRIEAAKVQLEPLAAPVQRAPHFVDYVLSGLSSELKAAGGTIHTTLDLHLQLRVEQAVRSHVDSQRARNLQQAGVVVLDSHSGAVLAMVGSADYLEEKHHGQINITTTPRTPGSALKPFTYALALEKGDTAASLALDIPDAIRDSLPKGRMPSGVAHGPVRYRQALPCSYNLAAVYVALRVGPNALLERLRDAGLVTLSEPALAYGPLLTLGNGPVRLIDLAAAYTFLTQGGMVVPHYSIERLALSGMPVTVPLRSVPRPLFSPEVSWLIQDILSDPDARRPVFGDDLPLDLPYRVAAKTGTSAGYSDNVAVLATSEYTVAAWAGNFDGTRMYEVIAMQGAAPLARAALQLAANGRRLTLPPPPRELIRHSICAISGLAPLPSCPHRLEWFIPGTQPQKSCTGHREAGQAVKTFGFFAKRRLFQEAH